MRLKILEIFARFLQISLKKVNLIFRVKIKRSLTKFLVKIVV
nr:MAG TPA: hypothetical protein [Bacteriophage sp.]